MSCVCVCAKSSQPIPDQKLPHTLSDPKSMLAGSLCVPVDAQQASCVDAQQTSKALKIRSVELRVEGAGGRS
jgi:hypothetical protein